jgi:hypothetical protein
MTEKAAEIDQLKGLTLEDISTMVEQINREFRNKQKQLQPLIQELKVSAHCLLLPLLYLARTRRFTCRLSPALRM